ncbi:MAG: DUF4172 domain-containing protein [Steroidobacteraceae bacterium]
MPRYIWQRPDWPRRRWSASQIAPRLATIQRKQDFLAGRSGRWLAHSKTCRTTDQGRAGYRLTRSRAIGSARRHRKRPYRSRAEHPLPCPARRRASPCCSCGT